MKVSLAPEDGYGQRDEDLCQGVPRSEFADVEDLAEGMEFQVESDAGPMVITVVEIGDDELEEFHEFISTWGLFEYGGSSASRLRERHRVDRT